MTSLYNPAVNRLFGAVLSAGNRLPPDLRAELDLWDSAAERRGGTAMTPEMLAQTIDLAGRIEAACPAQHGRVVRSSSAPPPA